MRSITVHCNGANDCGAHCAAPDFIDGACRLDTWVSVMKKILLIVLTVTLLSSLVFRAIYDRELVATVDVLIACLLTFVGAGERIAKLAMSMKSGEINLTIDQQVHDVLKQQATLSALGGKREEPRKAKYLIEELTGLEQRAWGKMVMIRVALRTLLRHVASERGMNVGEAESIDKMLRFLKEKAIIDDELYGQLERVRETTSKVEWGSEEPLTPEEAEFVLRDGKSLLIQVAGKLS